MVDRAGTALPFAQARSLLAELAGLTLTTKRVERAAEADGTTATAALHAGTAAILARRVLPLPPARPRPGHALHRRRRHRRAHGPGRDRRAGRQRARRAAPHPRGQTRRPVHPNPPRRRRPAGARPRLDQLPGHPRTRSSTSPTCSPPKPAAAAPTTSGNWSSSATAPAGSGTSPPPASPPPPRSSTCSTPANTCTPSPSQLAFILTDPATWLAERLADLDNGDTEALITAARVYPLVGAKADACDKALAYFESNAHRMRYAHYRKLGMFVGSGVVEAGCKAVIGGRLKLSGMRWTAHGATAITTLRCQHAMAA